MDSLYFSVSFHSISVSWSIRGNLHEPMVDNFAFLAWLPSCHFLLHRLLSPCMPEHTTLTLTKVTTTITTAMTTTTTTAKATSYYHNDHEEDDNNNDGDDNDNYNNDNKDEDSDNYSYNKCRPILVQGLRRDI